SWRGSELGYEGAVKVLRSSWVVPVDCPAIRDGAVGIDGDESVAVGPAGDVIARRGDGALQTSRGGASGLTDLGATVLLRGLLNAHTHLELSWMRSAAPPRGDC